jgi:uncharacterized RDD family membrane protein YckC
MTSPQPAPQASATGLPPGVEAGGLGRRFVAQLIDLLVPVILATATVFVVRMLGPGTTAYVVLIAGGVLVLAWAIFVCWGFAVKAAGPGMRLMGLQLVGFYDGRPIGWGRFLLRSLVLYALRLTGIGLLIMVVLLIMHPRKQGWHDLLVHSVVIKKRPLAPPRPRPVPAARRQAEFGTSQQGQYQPSGAGQSAPSYQPSGQPYQPAGQPYQQVGQQPPMPQPLTPPPGVEAGYRTGASQYGPPGQPAGGYGASGQQQPGPYGQPGQQQPGPYGQPGQQQPGPYGQPGQQYPPVTGFPTSGPDSYPGDPYRDQGQAAQYPAGGYGEDPYQAGPPAGGYQPPQSGMPTASASAPPITPPPGTAMPPGRRTPAGQPPTAQPPTGPPPQEMRPPQQAPAGPPDEAYSETQLAAPPPGYPPSAAAPPQTGWLAVLDDGRELSLTGLVLLGRNPQAQPGEEDAQLIKIADETRTVSKSHLAIAVDSGGVFVVDRGSTNGSTVTTSNGVSTRCAAGEVVRVAEGSIVSIGDHWLEIRRAS